MARTWSVYKRVLAFSLSFAFCAYPLINPDKFVLVGVALRVIVVIFIASQFFWIRRILDLGERFIPGKPRRTWLAVLAGTVYLFFFVYSFTHVGVVHLHVAPMGHLTGAARLRVVLMEGAFT